MPEVTASTKIVLGSVAAAAALITGLLGNVLAANISAFFSGTPPKTAPKAGKRPVILWLAFFVSASLSVVAGSVATFAPSAPTATASPGPTAAPTGISRPRVVVTNVSGSVVAQSPRNLLMVCRDTVELANTSDIPTSVIAVGSEVNVDGALLKLDPGEHAATASAGPVSVTVSPWRAAPDPKAYGRLKTLEQFGAILGEPLPVRSEARSTVAVYIDYALKLASVMPRSVSAVHVLRFPDIKDLSTASIKCQ